MCDEETHHVGTDPCVICLDPIEDPATLPCLHVFCFECIIIAAETFSLSRCAVCRTPFSTVRHRGTCEPVILPADHSEREPEERAGEEVQVLLTRSARRREDRRLMRNARRNVYLRRLYSKPLVWTDGLVRIKDTSPEFYRQNPAALHQLVPFMHRDLRLFLPSLLAKQLEQNLINKFKAHAITSETVNGYLKPYIGRFATHFLHEVRNFAQSIYRIKHYDRLVQYRRRHLPTSQTLANNDVTSTEVIEIPTINYVADTETIVIPDCDDVIQIEEGEIIELV
ncbi:E3 ubiquitin-protein ligase Topors-like [Oopsacas minuta]|uniref:RING-type E3 ubiquitin transferase n=1 Tax=Oopsacas minuta TaxID=111878 RepID=A0AAV7JIZ5_9METZ|nr:E3 ubiquitin-protein ligase Topors-like [Oopsacas minuta]